MPDEETSDLSRATRVGHIPTESEPQARPLQRAEVPRHWPAATCDEDLDYYEEFEEDDVTRPEAPTFLALTLELSRYTKV